MYPYDLLPGIDLYTVFLCLAAISAIIMYRVLADKMKLGAKLQNMCIFTAFGSIVFGYFSAILFQAFYNIKRDGKFIVNTGTGATFFGGLIGGAALFILIYFLVGGRIFRESGEHKKHFFEVADIAACSITLAHAIGRLGCLFAGCCHGKPTSAWFGIEMLIDGRMQKVIPTQLFETIFLLALLSYLLMRIKDKQSYCLQVYMCMYGVWRFVIEYLRNDYRGTTVVDFLTPSQLTAVIMVIAGVLLIIFQKNIQSLLDKEREPEAEKAGADEEYEEDEYDYDYESASSNETEEAQSSDDTDSK